MGGRQGVQGYGKRDRLFFEIGADRFRVFFRNGDDRKPGRPQLFLKRAELRHFRHAKGTPGSPEDEEGFAPALFGNPEDGRAGAGARIQSGQFQIRRDLTVQSPRLQIGRQSGISDITDNEAEEREGEEVRF